MTDSSSEKSLSEVLKAYPKGIIHLRRQLELGRFGLILGSGVSYDFEVPMWASFVHEIANDTKVKGQELLKDDVSKKSLPFQTELLFQLFRDNAIEAEYIDFSENDKQIVIKSRWLELCATHLYSKVTKTLEDGLKDHPYFLSLLPLVQKSHLTINFNFDDFLERSLASKKRSEDKSNRGYEIVTDPWPQFRRSNSVIYHPHGIVPFENKLMELPVDRFVFSEASYSTQYVGSRGHDSSFLLSHFARNTCLLLGCSLEDELRNVLMRGAQINPGNYHYYIHFISDSSKLTEEQKRFISETNFNVYNLITLYLNKLQIKALLDIINEETISKQKLSDLAAQNDVGLNYNYYLTGPIGVGKSTTANLLRNLLVLDEWLEPRPSVLGKPWDELTSQEAIEADEWIANQFFSKNNVLRHLDPAISIVDRPPLDPLTFTKKEDRPKKAKDLIDKICPKRKWEIVPGVVILLTGDPEILCSRVRATGRSEYTAKKLEKLQSTILDLYKGDGVHKIETKNLSILEVTKKVAEIIHRMNYQPFDLDGELKKHEGEFNATKN